MNTRAASIIASLALGAVAGAQVDTFDAYPANMQLDGVNGWRAWDANPAAGAGLSSLYARSGSSSLDIIGSSAGNVSDMVRTYDATSGRWSVTAWQYIPSTTTGADAYFIVLDTYSDLGPKHWATQVRFDLANNTVSDDLYGSFGNLPLVRDRWTPIRVDIDLDANTQVVSYDNQQLFSAPWLRYGGGQAAVAAIDLYGGSSSHVYYDDVGFASLPAPGPAALAGIAGLFFLRRARN